VEEKVALNFSQRPSKQPCLGSCSFPPNNRREIVETICIQVLKDKPKARFLPGSPLHLRPPNAWPAYCLSFGGWLPSRWGIILEPVETAHSNRIPSPALAGHKPGQA